MKNNSKEADRIQEPPEFAVKFANAVFVLGILFSVFVISLYVYRLFYPADGPYPDYMIASVYKYYFTIILIGGISATLFGLGLRLNNGQKVSLSLLIFTTGISVYAFETYLELQVLKQTRQQMAEKMGVPYDTRTTIEVLEDLRKDGIEAYPNVSPILFINSNGLDIHKEKIYPLGGISNITTILPNESGYYPIVETDEHGFNNSKGLYKKNKVDIVLTGDSFTEGYSVHSDETISAVLRKSGFNAISVGKVSNGPLLELAALKEYAEPLKPIIVLWLYYTNDQKNLHYEFNSLLLKKYLNEDNFSQNLMSRQNEIDSVLISYANQEYEKQTLRNDTKVFIQIIEKEIETQRVIEREKIINHWSIRVFKLTNLRPRLNLSPESGLLEIFKDILDKSKKMSSGWGGSLYFVYLPSITRYSTDKEHRYREFVLRTATELGIPVIDIHREVFAPHSSPLSLFPFRKYSHYNAEGYRLVAEAIAKRLKTDGFVPSNSNN